MVNDYLQYAKAISPKIATNSLIEGGVFVVNAAAINAAARFTRVDPKAAAVYAIVRTCLTLFSFKLFTRYCVNIKQEKVANTPQGMPSKDYFNTLKALDDAKEKGLDKALLGAVPLLGMGIYAGMRAARTVNPLTLRTIAVLEGIHLVEASLVAILNIKKE